MSKNAFTVDISGREHLEEWRPIFGYEGLYEASNLGRVRSPRTILKQRLHTNRHYPVVEFSKNGRSRESLVHRLVLLAFRGEPPEDTECCHINGIQTDNRLENLRWGSRSDNTIDQVRHGTHRNAVKTHCKRGHPLEGDNLYIRPNGGRNCMECRRMNLRMFYERRQSA